MADQVKHLNPDKDKEPKERMSAAMIAAILVVFMGIGVVAQSAGVPFFQAIGGSILLGVLVLIALQGGKVGVGFIVGLFLTVTLGSLLWQFNRWMTTWELPAPLSALQVTKFNWAFSWTLMFVFISLGNFASLKWRQPVKWMTLTGGALAALLLQNFDAYAFSVGGVVMLIGLYKFTAGKTREEASKLSVNMMYAVMGMLSTVESFFIGNIATWVSYALASTPEEAVCIIAGAMVGMMFAP